MKAKICIFVSVIVLFAGMLALNMLYNTSDKEEIKKKNKDIAWDPLEKEKLLESKTGDFETDLPVIYIDTDDAQILKEDKRECKIALNNASGQLRPVSDEPDEAYYATINHRGASSYSQFEKKQYRIDFFQDKQFKKEADVELFGMAGHSEWVLNGPFLDKTMMRNKLVYDLSREIMQWAPDTRYCELFLNGEYQGVYLATEPVTNGTGRLRLSKFGLLSGNTAFIVKRDRVGTETTSLKNYGTIAGKTVNELYLDYPTEDKVTPKEISWITKRISDFERALYKDDFAEKGEYLHYIDVDNFVDYYIINELFMNIDAGNLSTYVYEELNGKMCLAVWDFNNCLDNYQWGKHETNEFYILENPWFDRLLKDPAFVDRVVDRYYELRKTSLSEEHMLELLQQYQEEMGDAVERNFEVWGFSFYFDLLVDSYEDKRDAKSYEDACGQLKTTLHERLAFLDEHITDLYNGVTY